MALIFFIVLAVAAFWAVLGVMFFSLCRAASRADASRLAQFQDSTAAQRNTASGLMSLPIV